MLPMRKQAAGQQRRKKNIERRNGSSTSVYKHTCFCELPRVDDLKVWRKDMLGLEAATVADAAHTHAVHVGKEGVEACGRRGGRVGPLVR